MLKGKSGHNSSLILPAVAALGGMIIPAIIYAIVNWNNPVGLQGWGIPVATDIAFVLGVIALLGKSMPPALRLFLLTLSIYDDLAAIVIIAIFYTADVSLIMFCYAFACFVILGLFNLLKIRSLFPYLFVGLIMWLCVLKSGVHATLAGVLVGFLIPHHVYDKYGCSLMTKLEEELHPSVAFFILPLFAFVNSGVTLYDFSLPTLLNPITLGIILGLFIGKQSGIFLFSSIAIKSKLVSMPQNTSWVQLYGGAVLCGIGFTMSLFIASLSFPEALVMGSNNDRIGILLGSLLSGIGGYLLLRFSAKSSA
jgi:NhaA family Na+:H+ antiporter